MTLFHQTHSFDDDLCKYCKHPRRYHFEELKENGRLTTICKPKVLGFTGWCGCQKFQDPRGENNNDVQTIS